MDPKGRESEGKTGNDEGIYSLEDAQVIAMADAPYTGITTLGQTLLDQKYLEIENGENATERLPLLLEEVSSIRSAVLEEVNLNRNNVDVLAIAQGVSEAVAAAVLAKVEVDGSNYQNDYADMSGYEVKPWCEPVPVVSTYI